MVLSPINIRKMNIKTIMRSHFSTLKVKVKSLSCVWLFATPWTIAHQAPLSRGFPRQEYWSGLLFLSPGYLPKPRTEPRSLALQTDSLPSEPPEKPNVYTAILTMDNQQGPTVYHTELCSTLYGSLNGRIWGKMDTCVHMAESLKLSQHCVLIGYTPRQNF